MTRRPRPPRRARAGFTLVELVVSALVAVLIVAAAGDVLVRQHRFYAQSAAVVAGRAQLAGALAVLPAELRALAPRAGDVTALAADSVQFRATIGASVACAAIDALTLDFPPSDPIGPTLTAWTAAPRAGDTLAIYDAGDSARDSASDSASAPRWTLHAVDVFDAGGAYCAAPGPLSASTLAGPRYRVRVAAATPLPAGVAVGAAVRVLRHVRYKLYRAGDGLWYLGFTDYRAPGGWAGVQPVSGPYERTGASAAPFRFHDAVGVAVTDARREGLARVMIDLSAGGAPAGAARPWRAARESLSVAVRNAGG